MADKYGCFVELARSESADMFEIVERFGTMRHISIIAPHGGRIEPGTSQIARAIAGDLFNAYCFEGKRPRFNDHLHITSTNFDEPKALSMAGASEYIVTVHGCRDRSRHVYLGGLDFELIEAAERNLKQQGFFVGAHSNPRLQGKSRSNICNRGRRGVGLQLEIARDLRDEMIEEAGGQMLQKLSEAIRLSVLGVAVRE